MTTRIRTMKAALTALAFISFLILLQMRVQFAESKVLIVGANGRLGTAVAQLFQGQSLPVRLLVRDKEAIRPALANVLSSETANCIDIVEGDVLDLQSLVEATKGITAVIDAHGTRRFSKISDLFQNSRLLSAKKSSTHPFHVNYMGTQNLLAAMKQNKCQKLVRVTGALTVRWHEASEVLIRDAAKSFLKSYTVIRPTEMRLIPKCSETQTSDLVLNQGDAYVKRPRGDISIYDVADLCFLVATDIEVLDKSSVVVSTQAQTRTTPQLQWSQLIPKITQDYQTLLAQRGHTLAVTCALAITATAMTSLCVFATKLLLGIGKLLSTSFLTAFNRR